MNIYAVMRTLFLAWRRRAIFALIISVIAFLLRLYLAINGPIEYDEPVYVDAAIQYAGFIRTGELEGILSSQYNAEHPIFNKLIYGFGLLIHKPINKTSMIFDTPLREAPNFRKLLTLRLISVVFGTLSVFLLSLINPLAGIFLAVHTFAIKYSSLIYLEAVPSFFTLLGVFTFDWVYNHYDFESHKKIVTLLLSGSGIALGLAISSKYMYGIVPLSIILFMITTRRLRSMKSFFIIGIWGLLILVSFFLSDPILWISPVDRLLYSLRFHLNYSQSDPVVIDKSYEFWQPLLWLLLPIPHHSLANSPFFLRSGDYFFLIDSFIFLVAVSGLPLLRKQSKIMFWWLVISFLFLLLWQTKWPQYIMLILPPFCLSAGLGTERVWSLIRRISGNPKNDE